MSSLPHSIESNESDSENSECSISKKPESQKTKRNKISPVWKHFKKSSDKQFAKCIICGKEYKTSGNTSNLSDHLKRFHPTALNGCDKNEQGPSSPVSGTSSTQSVPSISTYFKREFNYDSSSQRKKALDNALFKMIAMDLQPFSIVNDEGFKQFVKLLDPRYELPSSFTLSNKMLEDTYLKLYNKLKLELQSIKYVSITFDAWTSLATECYVTVTCHYIDDNYCLKNIVLSTKPM